MDIDFPLVLTWAVLICGALWLLDVLLLKPRRLQAARSLEASGTRGEELERVLAEPKLVEYARSFFPVQLPRRALPDSFRVHGAHPRGG
jgi:signal peptidase I